MICWGSSSMARPPILGISLGAEISTAVIFPSWTVTVTVTSPFLPFAVADCLPLTPSPYSPPFPQPVNPKPHSAIPAAKPLAAAAFRKSRRESSVMGNLLLHLPNRQETCLPWQSYDKKPADYPTRSPDARNPRKDALPFCVTETQQAQGSQE